MDKIHKQIHVLEALVADAINRLKSPRAKKALEQAHDILVHQVAEYVRTAEARLKDEP